MQKKISYLDLFKEIANEQFDGHYTVMKFTTNYRVAFGTIMANDYKKPVNYLTDFKYSLTAFSTILLMGIIVSLE